MDTKRRLLAEQAEALRRGVGGDGLLDQLRVVDKAIALIVTRITAQRPPVATVIRPVGPQL